MPIRMTVSAFLAALVLMSRPAAAAPPSGGFDRDAGRPAVHDRLSLDAAPHARSGPASPLAYRRTSGLFETGKRWGSGEWSVVAVVVVVVVVIVAASSHHSGGGGGGGGGY